MVRGPAWDFVEELQHGRTTSKVRCKSCGHEFHGSATRICEHLFSIGVNVEACATPPPEIHTTLHKYITRAKDKEIQARPRASLASLGVRERVSVGESVHIDSNTPRDGLSTPGASGGGNFECGPSRDAPNTMPPSSEFARSKRHATGSLQAGFERQNMRELHLKWTAAFVACAIPFNVIRNPVFRDAVMSTAKAGFVLPDYNKMRTEYLDKLKSSLDTSLQRTVMDYVPTFGCTLAFDGWTNCQKKPLINIMLICPRGSVFLRAIDTSLKEKTSQYLEKLYEKAIAQVGGSKNVTAIVSDNASNYKGAGLAIQIKYPEITWVPCAAHTINLLLKDIGKMSFIQPALLETYHIVKFIREHQYTYALFKSRSEKCLRIFCETRFATAYYVLERLNDVRAALQETVADRRWHAWVQKNGQHGASATRCVQLVHSAVFWRNVERIIGVVQPFITLLRLVDSDKFIIGKVYWHMSEAIRHVKEYDKFTVRERSQIAQLAIARWNQMHTPLHGAAFALDPTYQVHGQSQNPEVVGNFRSVCSALLPGDGGRLAYQQRPLFANREGQFGDLWHLDAISKMSAPMWWKEYGCETIELQHVATRVLSVAASSGSCERNWAAFDFIHSKRRNRLKPSRAADLVYLFTNMRMHHMPETIATRAAMVRDSKTVTHDDVAEDICSEDDDELEIASENSDAEEIDDLTSVLVNNE